MAAEKDYQDILQQVELLQEEQEALSLKQQVLQEVVEGLSAASTCIQRVHQPATAADQHKLLLQEQHVQQEGFGHVSEADSSSCKEATTGGSGLNRESSSSSSQNSSRLQLSMEDLLPPSSSAITVQALEQSIQQHLTLIKDTGSSASDVFPATKVLLKLFTPDQVSKAMSMTLVEVVERLRHLAGKCAMLLLHGGDELALWSKDLVLEQACSSVSQESTQRPQASWQEQESFGSFQDDLAADLALSPLLALTPPEGDLLVYDDLVGSGAAAQGLGPTALGSGALPEMYSGSHPALEYTVLVLILMLWDHHSFAQILSMNLETMEVACEMPPSHWQSVARKVELSAQQVQSFDAMNSIVLKVRASLHNQFKQTANQQRDEVQSQHSSLHRLLHLLDGKHSSKAVSSVWEVRQAHVAAATDDDDELAVVEGMKQQKAVQQQCVTKQETLLRQLRLLGLQQGIHAINCLSLRQLTICCAMCYPALSKVDLIVTAFKDVASLQKLSSQQLSATADQ
eukprot:gene2037-2359_t